jgi:hypothetical protein
MNAKSFLFSSSLFAVALFLASPVEAMDAPVGDRSSSSSARHAPAAAAAAAAAAPAFNRDDRDLLDFMELLSFSEERLQERFFRKVRLGDPSEEMDRLIQRVGPKFVDLRSRDILNAEHGLRCQSGIEERSAETSKSILDEQIEQIRQEMHRINASEELSQVAKVATVRESLSAPMLKCISEICQERPRIRKQERDKRLEIEGRLAADRDDHKKAIELIEKLKTVRRMIPQKVAEYEQELARRLEQYRQQHQMTAGDKKETDKTGDN